MTVKLREQESVGTLSPDVGRGAKTATRIGYNIGYNNGIYNVVTKRLANNGDLEYKNSNVELHSELLK